MTTASPVVRDRMVHARSELAKLFAPVPNPRVITRRDVVAGAAVVLLGALVSLMRINGGPLNVLWAEDASNFMTDAYLYRPWDSLFISLNGYHLFYARVLAEFASMFPVAWGAGVLIATTAASSAAMGLIVYVASGQLLRHPVPRAIAASAIIITPLAFGMANQVAPLHFVMLYAAFWCLMWTPASRVARVVQFAVLLLVSVSTILAVFLLPLAALRVWACWNRYSAILAGLLAPGLVLQVASLLTGAASRRDISSPRIDPVWATKALVTWGLPLSVGGNNGLRDLGQASGDYTGSGTGWVYWFVVVASWALLVAVVVVAARRITSPNCWFAAVAFGQAAIFYYGMIMTHGHLVDRYLYTPFLVVIAGICALLLPRSSTEPAQAVSRHWPMAALAVVLVLIGGLNFRSVADPRPPWDEAVRRAQAECADPAASVGFARMGDSGWGVTIPCDRLR